MVRDVLATLISTIVFESAFSIGSRVLDAFRSSLNLPTVKILTKIWLETIITQFDGINANEEFELSEKTFTSLVYFPSKILL